MRANEERGYRAPCPHGDCTTVRVMLTRKCISTPFILSLCLINAASSGPPHSCSTPPCPALPHPRPSSLVSCSSSPHAGTPSVVQAGDMLELPSNQHMEQFPVEPFPLRGACQVSVQCTCFNALQAIIPHTATRDAVLCSAVQSSVVHGP